MVSIKNLLSSAIFATLALAQGTNFSATDIQALASSQSNPSAQDRLAWCQGQRTICGTLCSGNALNNTCDSNTLNWDCNCGNNNSRPALQYYQTSMITYECNSLLGKCLARNANDLGSQDNCKKMYVCGNATSSDAEKAAAAVSSSPSSAPSSAASGAAASSGSGSGGSGSVSQPSRGAAAAAYGEFAPPMFVMMMVGAIASFL